MSPSPAPDISDNSCRLNRAIAKRGYCSRRKADELIFAGMVKVNGTVEKNPATRVSENDTLEIEGKSLSLQKKNVYVMLNKPIHVVCSAHDPQGRTTVLDILPPSLKKYRLFPVGRLDYFSEGLLLLTNDGDFAQHMAHPANGQEKIYEVLIRGKVDAESIKNMRDGMSLADGTKLLPVKVSSKALANGNTLLLVHLHQGKNRQIRKMCDTSGLVILRLKRIKQGIFELGNLETGKCREIEPQEIKNCALSRPRPKKLG